ncbi:MAG: hypothetical protein V4543_04765 [Bacteroidota bacterium]
MFSNMLRTAGAEISGQYRTYTILAFLAVFISVCPVWAQQAEADSTFDRYNAESDHIQQLSMKDLSVLTAANLVSTGVFVYLNGENAPNDGNLMLYEGFNFAWNAGTFAISLMGAPPKNGSKGLTAYQTLQRQKRFELIYGFSLGLDCVYMATGLHVFDNARRIGDPDRSAFTKAFSYSVLSQGVLFILYDGLMLWRHKRHNAGNNILFENLKPAKNGIGLQYQF